MKLQNGADGSLRDAKVDDHHRVYTLSNHVSHEQHHATYHKDLFYIPFSTTLGGTDPTPVVFVQNTESNTDLELFDILISADAAMRVTGKFSATYTSGGAAASPVNTNIGTPIVLGADAYEGGASDDMVLDETGVETIGNLNIGASQPVVWASKGGIVLPNKRSFYMLADGTAGDIIDVTLVCSFHEAGTKL